MSNILVVNTKGGVGKSFVATQILPLALNNNNSNINIFELDNNNKTTLKSNLINFKNLNTSNLDEILFDVSFSDEITNIIDAGGGNDTIQVIEALAKNDVEIDYFIIPILKDFEVTKNLLDTINLIKKEFENPKITIILNKLNNDYKKEFIYIFGAQDYGIEGILGELEDIKILAIKDYNEIDIVKNIYNTTAKDLLETGQEIIDNFAEYKAEWHKEAKETEDPRSYFAKKMGFYRLIKNLIQIQTNIKTLFNF